MIKKGIPNPHNSVYKIRHRNPFNDIYSIVYTFIDKAYVLKDSSLLYSFQSKFYVTFYIIWAMDDWTEYQLYFKSDHHTRSIHVAYTEHVLVYK